MSADLDRYLWDGSGAPDPEVARLEHVLGPYRHDAPLRPLPALHSRVQGDLGEKRPRPRGLGHRGSHGPREPA